MKPLVLFIFFCVLAVGAHGQLLFQTDIVPEAGEQFSVHRARNAAALSPGSGGINAVWDWSAALFSTDSFMVKKTVLASGSPYAVLFPAATMAVESYNNYNAANKAYDYFKLDTGLSYFYLGNRANGVTRLYTNTSKDFHFPFGYNNAYDDDFCFDAQSTSGNVGYCGSMNLHFDGIGTLILPYGTYTGIYRIRRTRAEVMDGTSDTLFTTVYSWYKSGLHHPLATYEETHSTAGGAVMLQATVLSSGINGIGSAKDDNRSLRVYPNPFHQVVFVSLDVASEYEVLVHTTDGRLMAQSQATTSPRFKLDLNHLPAGVYLLTVRTNNGLRREVVVKE
jgi:hypothetical protein